MLGQPVNEKMLSNSIIEIVKCENNEFSLYKVRIQRLNFSKRK
jgi:hypothetical protein